MSIIPRLIAPNESDRREIMRERILAVCDGVERRMAAIVAEAEAAVEQAEIAYAKAARRRLVDLP